MTIIKKENNNNDYFVYVCIYLILQINYFLLHLSLFLCQPITSRKSHACNYHIEWNHGIWLRGNTITI